MRPSSTALESESVTVPGTVVELQIDTPDPPEEPDAAVTLSVKVFELPDALAVMTALWAVLVLEAEAVNVALDAPARTVALAGTDTTELFDERDTVICDVVVPVSAIVHVDVAPDAMDDGLQLSDESVGPLAGGVSESGKVTLVAPFEAVSVAVWLLVTLDTVAVNDALVCPAGTETLDGTVTFALLLLRVTGKLEVGALPPRLTVHEAVPGDCTDVGLHARPLSVVV